MVIWAEGPGGNYKGMEAKWCVSSNGEALPGEAQGKWLSGRPPYPQLINYGDHRDKTVR